MRGHLVFSTAQRYFHASVPKNVKSKPKIVATDIGYAIKRLNKENKALFGKLLESRKQKRKNSTKVFNSSVAVEDGKPDLSSEVWWWKETSSNRTVTLHVNWRKNEPELNREHIHQSVQGIDKNSGSCETVEFSRPDDPHCDSRIVANKVFKNPGVPKFDSTQQGLSECCNEKLYLKEVMPVIPSVVIGKLNSFPFQNNKKKVIDWPLGDKDLLCIPAYNKNENAVKKSLPYPSVTKILSTTMSESSRSALERWRQKMIMQLGEEGFAFFQRDLLEQGSKFHNALQHFLSGSPADLSLDSSIEGCWASVGAVLSDITDVRVLEGHVVHPHLKYHGVIDCVAKHCDTPVLIEWKRSDRKKPKLMNTYDAPIQLCAYLGAMNYDDNYKIKVQKGLVVVAYTDGSPAEIFKLKAEDCRRYWGIWLGRLQEYWMQQNQESAHVSPGEEVDDI